MKKFAFILGCLLVLCAAGQAYAEKGWHKGPYVLVTGGFNQMTNDKNADSNEKFGSSIAPAVGFTAGYDFTDWIGAMFQARYAFDKGDIAGDGTAAHPAETNVKEHFLALSLASRVTFLTNLDEIAGTFHFLPYVKLGAGASGLYVKAANAGNKIGAWGYGPTVGAGLEVLIKKLFWVGIDFSEDLYFMQSVKKTVNGVADTEILKGGFKPQFAFQGVLGVHF